MSSKDKFKYLNFDWGFPIFLSFMFLASVVYSLIMNAQTLDGIWRQSDEWTSRKIEIKGNNYIFSTSMGGNVDNKSGSLKIFKVESKNTFGEDITLDAIQLLDMPHKPILWLDSEANELQTPWTWLGKTKIYTEGGYLEGLIFKKD